MILLAVFAVLVGRAISVYLLVPASNLVAEKIPVGWQHVMVWGGLRGRPGLGSGPQPRPQLPGARRNSRTDFRSGGFFGAHHATFPGAIAACRGQAGTGPSRSVGRSRLNT